MEEQYDIFEELFPKKDMKAKYTPIKGLDELTEMSGLPFEHTQYVYHGSPVDNLKSFDISKVGSEFGSDYGMGIYTGDYRTGKIYADPQGNYGKPGHLYKVEVPRDEYLYDVDKPFRRQSKYVRDKIINWNEIPKQNKQQWIDMLLGRANPLEEGLDVINSMELSDGSYGKVGGLLEKMGIHGKSVTPQEGWRPFKIIFNPKYAKIVDQLFGMVDPWTMNDMVKTQGLDPRRLYGKGKKQLQEEAQQYWQEQNPNYRMEIQDDGTPLFYL